MEWTDSHFSTGTPLATGHLIGWLHCDLYGSSITLTIPVSFHQNELKVKNSETLQLLISYMLL